MEVEARVWDESSEEWVKLQVDENGYLIVATE